MADKKQLAYWIVTGLFCAAMATSGIIDLLQPEFITENMDRLGIPHYVLYVLGTGKVLGVIALLAPGLKIPKEWAYAGFTFDLVGAIFSHLAVSDPVEESLTPFILLLIMISSYILRPESRRVK